MERFKELLEKRWSRRPSRWSLPDVQARRKVTMTKKIDTIPDASFVSSVLVRSTIINGSLV